MTKCDRCGETFGHHLPWCKVESEHRQQPSPWSCLPAAFAICMRLEPTEIIEKLGHDDSRGFHPFELTWLAIELGHVFTPFDFPTLLDPQACHECEGCRCIEIVDKACICFKRIVCICDRCPRGYLHTECKECSKCNGTGIEADTSFLKVPSLEHLLKKYDGVLTGVVNNHPHAVCWRHQEAKIYDPNYDVYSVEHFKVETFWVMTC